MTSPTGEQSSPPALTRREHRFLWLMSQGYTPDQAGMLMSISGTASVGSRMRLKLGARTNAHAVAVAYQLDMLGPYEECGSERGYRAHGGRHEDCCRACRRAHADYVERNQDMPAYQSRITLTEAETRLLRAWDAGRSNVQVRKNWGVSVKTLEGLTTSVYRKLDVRHLPVQGRRYAALDEGRRRGLLRPREQPVLVLAQRQAPPLSDLELKTLAAVADGATLAQAGEVLSIPRQQVSSRLARIYKKLDVAHHASGYRREAALAAARKAGYQL